jgi:hypothetical protein
LDEDVYHAVAIGLRRRGFDVLTTYEARRQGTSDEMQLRFAAAEGRAIFTFNRGDFARLHGAFLARAEHHYGIVLARQRGIDDRELGQGSTRRVTSCSRSGCQF